MSLNIKNKIKQTEDGAVEYKAVECQKCECDVLLKEAVIPVLPRKIETPTYAPYFRVEYGGDCNQYAFCEECAVGIFGNVKVGNYQRELNDFMDERSSQFLLVASMHFFLIIFAFIGLLSFIAFFI